MFYPYFSSLSKSAWLAIVTLIVFVGGLILGASFVNQKIATPKRELSITQELSTQQKITPDTFSAKINIGAKENLRIAANLSNEQQAKIIKDANAINEIVVGAKGVCNDGSFELRPAQYYLQEHINGKVFEKRVWGFEFSQNIECEFKQNQKEKYEKVLNGVRKIALGNEYLNIEIPKIVPIFTQEQVRDKNQEMRNEILTKAQKITKDYSRIMNTKCAVTSIRFADYKDVVQPRYYAKQSSAVMYDAQSAGESIQSAMPVTKEDEVSLSANFSIGCEL